MLTIRFNPFPELSTERLRLRKIDHKDAPEIFAIRSNKDTMKYIPRKVMESEADALELIEKFNAGIDNQESINWGITLKNTNQLIGVIGYVRMTKDASRAEVGYILNPQHHSSGIMHEALQAVLDYGFEMMNLHSIEAIIHPDNIASQRLIEKNAFVKEGYFKDFNFSPQHNRFDDAIAYSLIKTR